MIPVGPSPFIRQFIFYIGYFCAGDPSCLPGRSKIGFGPFHIHLVNTSGDSTAFCRLVQEVLKKTMLPSALIVGVAPAPAPKPDSKKWMTPEYVDAKGVFSSQLDKEEMYYQLVSREVMPYIQQNHKISITMLGSDGDAAFTNYVLSNHAAAFQAYLSLQPFALFENEVNM